MGYIGGLGGFLPLHDEKMMTTRDGIYAAGDCTGVEEASTAMEEGRLAGLSSAYAMGKIAFEDYERKVEEINRNMMDLRIGSYGDERERCKEEIHRRYALLNG